MPPIRHIFLDDGDVMNDNAVRGPQWQRLIGEFFVPRLGGTMEAWAAANTSIVDEVDGRYWSALSAGRPGDAVWREYNIDWLRSMAAEVGVQVPDDDDDCHALAQTAIGFIRPRIQSAYPGAIEAIKRLAADKYELYTASNEHSEVLQAYLEGMGVRHLFRAFYGPDLVRAIKPDVAYYERIFADSGVDPAASLVLDDKLSHLESAAAAGARIVVVSTDAPLDGEVPVIRALADLPALLASERLE
ncbi:MAG: HAD-IA family hydrolase [Dehalococcoidia bacterium]|nr:HAD-IA family hydrolase [Dehalococcoidia bacterium]